MRFGIAYKINLIVLAAILVLGGALGALFVVEQDRALRAALDQRVRMLGRQVATSLSRSSSADDLAAVDSVLLTVVDPEVAYLLLKSRDGTVLAGRWIDAGRGSVVEYEFPVTARNAREPTPAPEAFGLVEAAPGSVPIGTLAIGVDLSHLRQHRLEQVRRVAASTVGAALVAALLGLSLVQFIMRRAMTPLLEAIRDVAGGDLSRRVTVGDRHDELADIGRVFNEMASRLGETLVSKGELEATVARRTSELTQALAERQRARDLAAEREAQVRLLLDSTAEAIYGIGAAGLCTFANAAAARMLGYGSPDELVGRNMHDLVHHSLADGSHPPEQDCRIYRTLREGKGYHSDDELLWRKDGTSFPVELWSYPMFRDGVRVGAVVTFLDLTERRRLEGEVLKMRKLESLGVLAGGIAHDFNNLLMVILGSLSLAREEVPPRGEAAELLRDAEQATVRARQLTQQLLTFSRGGAPVKKVIEVRPVVEEAARFALSGSAVRAEHRFAPDLPPVEADAGQLGQVLHNLVINAVQAMPRGGVIRISTDGVELAAGSGLPLPAGPYVRIAVEDEGAGIPPDHLPRIFDPYFTTKAGGHGLGLASVYSIARRHGGHVTVASDLGKGTTFTVYLPAAPGATPAATASPPVPSPAGSRGRALVMDDDAAVLKVATSMLQRLGYEVEATHDGAVAVDAARTAIDAGRPFDLLLLDLTVPGGMGGLEALQRIRGFAQDVTAIATSGYSSDPVMADFRAHGFSGSVAKPYTPRDLQEAIAAARGARRGG